MKLLTAIFIYAIACPAVYLIDLHVLHNVEYMKIEGSWLFSFLVITAIPSMFSSDSTMTQKDWMQLIYLAPLALALITYFLMSLMESEDIEKIEEENKSLKEKLSLEEENKKLKEQLAAINQKEEA